MAARKTHKIDASGKILGRLAVEIAKLLRGKDKVDFTLNTDKGDQVVVFNCDKVKITGRKIETKNIIAIVVTLETLKKKVIRKLQATRYFTLQLRECFPTTALDNGG